MTLVPPSSKLSAGVYALGQSNTQHQLANPGDTNEHLLTSLAIPANTLGPNGTLEILALWDYTNSANNKTLRVRFGTANDLTGTAFTASAVSTSASVRTITTVTNRGATNSQIGASATNIGIGNVSGGANVTAAIDTTVQTFVVVSAQLALGTETVNLEVFSVRLLPGV